MASRSMLGVRIVSLTFVVFTPLLALCATAGVIAFWGFGLDRWGNAALGDNFIVLADVPPVADRRIYGLLATLPPLILSLCAMAHIFALFLTFSAGNLVAQRTIQHLRAFSGYSALAVICGFLLSGVMRWALGVFNDAPFWTHLGFSVTHAAILFGAAIVYAASYIIEEGFAYRQELGDYI